MARYISDAELGQRVSFDVDENQFGSLEMTATLMMVRETGKSQILNTTVGGSIVSTPVVYKDRVYFGACDKNVYCSGLEGKELWRFPTKDPVIATIKIYDGIVYVGSMDGIVYAISADTGEEVWRFRTNGKILSSVILDEYTGHLYVGSGDGNMYALDKKGRLIWRFPTNAEITSTPTFDENRVYFGSYDKNFYAVDKNGNLVWRFRTKNQLVCVSAIYKGVVYFGSFDHNLYALDKETGRLLWKFTAKDGVYHAGVCNETVYCGSRDGYMYALTPDGKLKWKFHTNDILPAIPAVQDGAVYFGSGDSNFYALEEKTGKMLWKFETNGPIFQRSVGIHREVIYFGSWDCNVYAITAGGELVWKFHTSLSNPSKIEVQTGGPQKTAEIIWTPEKGGEEKKYKAGETDIADYGTFSGTYIDTTKTDYLGHKKKGYKAG
jgi:outer membrane protein assembly factor BamB